MPVARPSPPPVPRVGGVASTRATPGRRVPGLLAVLALLGLALTGCAGVGGGPGSPSSPGPERASRADPFEETRRMIEQAQALGLPPGNYRVDVQRLFVSESEYESLGAVFGYTDEHVDVRLGTEPGGPAAEGGFRIGVAKDGFWGAVDVAAGSAQHSDRSSLFLVTVADSPASIHVGEQRYVVPVTVLLPRHLSYGGGLIGELVLPQGQFIGASLEVTVSPAGPGSVAVALTPIFSGLGDDRHSVELTELTTTVIAPLDTPFVIGSHDRQIHDVASTLLSRRSEQGSERGLLILTVTGG